MASAATASVALHGWGDLRRDLKAVDRALPRELGKDAKQVVERSVLPEARTLTPKGATGKLAASEKVSAAGNRVSLRSALPYANVRHWGGTTGKGHRPGVGGSGSVRVKPSPFFADAAESKAEHVLQGLADGVDALLGRHGFK